jgi:Protein of unknown function (DUF4231)
VTVPPGTGVTSANTPTRPRDRWSWLREMRTRSARWLRNLRSGFGVPQYQLVEVDRLEEHMRRRLHSLTVASPSQPEPMDEEQLDDWVAARFTSPMRILLLQASRNSRGHVLLSLVVIAGGFVTSGIAVSTAGVHKHSTTSWIVFSVGLAVALAGGVSQLFRPGHRAAVRAALAIDLREQGWAFVNSTKPYNKPVKIAFELFEQRISEIHRRAAALVEVEPTKR